MTYLQDSAATCVGLASDELCMPERGRRAAILTPLFDRRSAKRAPHRGEAAPRPAPPAGARYRFRFFFGGNVRSGASSCSIFSRHVR